jgi:hypothetical protein
MQIIDIIKTKIINFQNVRYEKKQKKIQDMKSRQLLINSIGYFTSNNLNSRINREIHQPYKRVRWESKLSFK